MTSLTEATNFLETLFGQLIELYKKELGISDG